MTIYLYKKTHNKTGLKYLGKTTQNPFKYKGSGKDWLPHLSEHGHDVTTEILKECQTKEELRYWGLYYSKLWRVVESDEWANRIPETGGGPGKKAVLVEPPYNVRLPAVNTGKQAVSLTTHHNTLTYTQVSEEATIKAIEEILTKRSLKISNRLQNSINGRQCKGSKRREHIRSAISLRQ